jgi:hypothetical protein
MWEGGGEKRARAGCGWGVGVERSGGGGGGGGGGGAGRDVGARRWCLAGVRGVRCAGHEKNSRAERVRECNEEAELIMGCKIGKKSFRQIFRDPAILRIIFLLPTVQFSRVAICRQL